MGKNPKSPEKKEIGTILKGIIMKGHISSNRYFLICMALFMTFLLLAVSGCRKESSESENHDPVVWVLRDIIKTPDIPVQVRNRAELAISQWQNDVVDCKPILVNAVLGKPQGFDKVLLALIIFDEDRDTVGFVIKEEYVDSNGVKTTLEEDYPAYVHCLPFAVVDAHWVAIQIRDKHQQKDEQRWQKYVKSDFNELVKEYIQSDKFSVDSFYPGEFWEDTLPPVLVSVPEPNEVDVWVYVYDKAGNKSEDVKLLDFTRRTGEN
ncbi:MAG: hypothetical protein ACYS0I_07490 [Planctomycetota bacterium]